MPLFKPGEAPESKPGGIVLVSGMEKVGKTWFLINTWDVVERLFYANFDRDASHLIKSYKGKGGTDYEEYTAVTKKQAESELNRLDAQMARAKAAKTGVFALDNSSAWWDIVKLALAPTGKPIPREFAEANTYARNFMISAERSGLWVLLATPPKEIWSGAKTTTGQYDAEGWKHQDFHMMAEVWLYCDRPAGSLPQPVGSGQMIGGGEDHKGPDALELPADPEYNKDGIVTRGFPAPMFKAQIQIAAKRASVEGMIMKDPTLYKVLKAMKEIE